MSDSRTLEFLKGIIIGGAIGAVVGLLYAPKSGRETREELSGRVDDVYRQARDEYEDALVKARDSYEATLKRLRDLEDEARAKYADMKTGAEDLLDDAESGVEEGKSRLKDAIDAAKTAFNGEQPANGEANGDEKDA